MVDTRVTMLGFYVMVRYPGIFEGVVAWMVVG